MRQGIGVLGFLVLGLWFWVLVFVVAFPEGGYISSPGCLVNRPHFAQPVRVATKTTTALLKTTFLTFLDTIDVAG